jgi:predicted aminopeptidase
MALLSSRTSLDKSLQDPSLSEEDKAKIRLSQKARAFAETELHLRTTKNYSRFVKLDRPFVTYVVSAAPKWELKHYEWSYPFVGKMPYKGFFSEQDAMAEEADLKALDLDTNLRGVSAFSTLGWFEDPLLSSMLRYKDYDLVNTIIHETVHATLYIKNSADFNERMAVFIGNIGAEMYYQKYDGPQSPTLQQVHAENEDEKIFSQFIGDEIKSIQQWYEAKPERNENLRKERLSQILTQFSQNIEPKLKSKSYKKFKSTPLNNAKLLLYKTYNQDLNDFEKLFALCDRDFQKFIEQCRTLETHKKPELGLKELIQKIEAEKK